MKKIKKTIKRKIKRKQRLLVEICRSFSFHLNLGNYQGCDFFCSEKSMVESKNAKKTSEILYQFCKEEVVRAINQYKKEVFGREELPKIKPPNVFVKEMKEAPELDAKLRIGEEMQENKQKMDEFIKRSEAESDLKI